MIKIAEEIAKLDLDAINAETSVDLKWVKLKEALLAIIDSIAPVKTIKIKRREIPLGR